ncbi:MAG: restriction endonuclease subunit S [Crocosphaera sp.]
MVSFPKYDSYKDSGVQWLGDIPEHWEVKRLKYLAKIKNGQEYKLVRTDDIGYPVIGSGGQFAYASKYLFKGESVLLGRKGTIDKPLYVNCSFWTVDTMFYTEIKNNTFPKFLYYSTLTIPFKYFSTNTAVPSMTQEDLSNNFLVYPPIEEQQKIAKFLDEKTGEIEEAISHKQRLIELLQEQKAILINQAVTKGLNPNVSMRDSGIEWLGDIPEHWEVRKLNYSGFCSNGVSKGANYFGSGYPFVNYSDVYNNFELPKNVIGLAKSTDTDRINYSVNKGDIFFTRTSETVEEIGLSSTCLETLENAIFSGFLIRFRPYKNLLFPNFSKYYFRCQSHRFFFIREMNLVTRASLSQELLKRLPILLPPLQEQERIASFLDKQTAEIQELINQIKQQIDKLNELKQILISDAVTGKIKVS